MKKILFRKLLFDCLVFFTITLFASSIIIWIFQAVNFLDIMIEDGREYNVYINYALLNFPKIFSKIMIFSYFVSLVYIINKYQSNNEILIFWTNGISKIRLINFIIKEYPDTDYALDGKYKLELIEDILAAKEIYIARYYIKKEKWIAAVNGLKFIVNNYGTTIFVEEALHRLVEVYYILGLEGMKSETIGYFRKNKGDLYGQSISDRWFRIYCSSLYRSTLRKGIWRKNNS